MRRVWIGITHGTDKYDIDGSASKLTIVEGNGVVEYDIPEGEYTVNQMFNVLNSIGLSVSRGEYRGDINQSFFVFFLDDSQTSMLGSFVDALGGDISIDNGYRI